MGYSPRGHTESDTTEVTWHTHPAFGDLPQSAQKEVHAQNQTLVIYTMEEVMYVDRASVTGQSACPEHLMLDKVLVCTDGHFAR